MLEEATKLPQSKKNVLKVINTHIHTCIKIIHTYHWPSQHHIVHHEAIVTAETETMKEMNGQGCIISQEYLYSTK